MKRLAATMATDVRVQARNGFYAATAVVVVSSIALLRWLPQEPAAMLLPVVILSNVLVNAFYFVSGLLLLERVEGTVTAQSVTPLRADEYLASKVATLTVLSVVEGLLVAGAVMGADSRLIVIAAGIAVSALLFCLAGVALAARYESINEFLMPSVLHATVLTLPVLGVFGVGPVAWYLLHPIHAALALLQADAQLSAGGVTWAISYSLLWTIPAWVWSRRAVARLRCS